MKRLLIVAVCAMFLQLHADKDNSGSVLKVRLQELQQTLDALKKKLQTSRAPKPHIPDVPSRIPGTPKIEKPIERVAGKKEIIKKQLDAIIANYFEKGTAPFAKYQEYMGLVNNYEGLLGKKDSKHYAYVGADAALKYFTQNFANLPREQMLKGVVSYTKQPANFEDVIDLYNDILEVFAENYNSYNPQASSDLIKYNTVLAQNLILDKSLKYLLLGLFDDKTRAFKGYPGSNEPFKEEHYDEFINSIDILRKKAIKDPGLDVWINNYKDWEPILEVAVGKPPAFEVPLPPPPREAPPSPPISPRILQQQQEKLRAELQNESAEYTKNPTAFDKKRAQEVIEKYERYRTVMEKQNIEPEVAITRFIVRLRQI